MPEMRLPVEAEVGESGSDNMPQLRSEIPKEITREELERMYWREKKSTPQIARERKRDSKTIWSWMDKFGIPRRSFSEASKLAYTPRFIEINVLPSRDLVYVLGVIKGDGCVHIKKNSRSGITQLAQIRFDFAKTFEGALKNLGFNSNTFIQTRVKTNYSDKPKPRFVTYGYSYKFARWYKQLSLGDIEKILSNNLEYIRAFIRGFYESEGTNGIYLRENNRTSWTVNIRGTNGELFDLLERLLTKLGYNFKRFYLHRGGTWKPIHLLSSGNREQNYRFINEIKPCIKNQIPSGWA